LRQHTSEDLPRQEHGEDGERSEYRDHDRAWRRLIPTECRQVHPPVWNRQGDQAHVAKAATTNRNPAGVNRNGRALFILSPHLRTREVSST